MGSEQIRDYRKEVGENKTAKQEKQVRSEKKT
jgi:hypothetical protein